MKISSPLEGEDGLKPQASIQVGGNLCAMHPPPASMLRIWASLPLKEGGI